MKLRFAFVFVVIAAGVCIYMFRPSRMLSASSEGATRRSSHAGNIRGEDDDVPAGALDAVNGRLDALAAEVALLRQQVAAREPTTPSVMAIPSAATLPARDPEALARWEEERHGEMADVEAKFRAERRDLNWSTVSESTIRDVINICSDRNYEF